VAFLMRQCQNPQAKAFSAFLIVPLQPF